LGLGAKLAKIILDAKRVVNSQSSLVACRLLGPIVDLLLGTGKDMKSRRFVAVNFVLFAHPKGPDSRGDFATCLGRVIKHSRVEGAIGADEKFWGRWCFP